MKTHLLSLVGLLVCPFLFSQILTVSDGSSVSINSGSSITIDGLEIAPADTYTISGANDVSRSATAASVDTNSFCVPCVQYFCSTVRLYRNTYFLLS